MSTVFVKPIAGATIQTFDTKTAIPAEGMEVTLDTFWSRRIADGSVVVVDKTITAATEEPAETAVESVTNTKRGR